MIPFASSLASFAFLSFKHRYFSILVRFIVKPIHFLTLPHSYATLVLSFRNFGNETYVQDSSNEFNYTLTTSSSIIFKLSCNSLIFCPKERVSLSLAVLKIRMNKC